MAVTTVFFDFGGTLLIMRRDRIISRILSEVGYTADPENVHSAYFRVEPWWLKVYGDKVMTGGETEEAYRRLDAMIFQLLFPERSPSEIERVSGLMRQGWPRVEKTVPLELYADAVPTLDTLKSQGYALGMVSNAPPDTLGVIERLGLLRYFPVVLVSGVVGVSKPNPEIFRIALGKARAKPEETVHVGDVYEADVVGARNAGIKGILLDRTGSQLEPDCPRIQSLSEIFLHLR
jgi:HAD superfamily hydrolase (TIGR01549 family)